MKRDEPLSPKQSIALASLLAGKSAEAAAKDADCDPKTVRRWIRKDRRFIREFRTAQELLLGQARSVLSKAIGKAVVGMLRAMDSENEFLAYRASSENYALIEAIIGEGELRRRIEALEARQSGRPTRTRPR